MKFGRARAEAPARDQGGRTPLFYAVVDGRTDEVRRLVADGADVSAQDLEGRRPLHAAAMYQRIDALHLLLAAGAEVDPRDDKGNTPLFYATTFSKGEGDCIVALLRAGADRHAVNAYGHSPLEASQVVANVDLARWYADGA